MTYRLLRQERAPERWRATYVDGIDVDAFRCGRPVSDPPATALVMLYAEGEERSDFLDLPVLIMSDAMRGALERSGIDNLQYFRAELQLDWSSRRFYGYWVANLIGTVSCVDRPASRFETTGDGEVGALLGFSIDL